jgi:hypothetical protein
MTMPRRFNQNLLPLLACAAIYCLSSVADAADCPGPGPQPRPGPSVVTQSPDGTTTFISTGHTEFPPSDTFGPNPSNLLPTIYENMCDAGGDTMPNTLPSTIEQPYNLHPDPEVSAIDITSPTDDLQSIFGHLRDALANHRKIDQGRVQFAIDIIEGNPVERSYTGFPLLHYNGPDKVKAVTPIMNGPDVVGGTVTVHQIWYDSHIESDTSYIDPSLVNDVPWTIRYVIDVLNRGHEDFAPNVVYFDDPDDVGSRIPHVGMDQTFFPMEEGLRYIFEVQMTPGRYWNLTYNWGWRVHPPRIQAIENVTVPVAGMPRNAFEIQVFGENPTANEAAKLAAIDMIGNMAPAKRMWLAFRAIKAGAHGKKLRDLVDEAQDAFFNWQNRNELPTGVEEDASSDVTLFYVNNTIYGHVNGYVDDSQVKITQFSNRGDTVKLKLLNGDYFVHSYALADFGGLRGWENTFHNTVPIGGAGPWFTFGRHHWWVETTSGPVPVPPAIRPVGKPGRIIDMSNLPETANDMAGTPAWMKLLTWNVSNKKTEQGLGEHNIELTFNYDPSPRLRMYQFDALHHDVAIWSMH